MGNMAPFTLLLLLALVTSTSSQSVQVGGFMTHFPKGPGSDGFFQVDLRFRETYKGDCDLSNKWTCLEGDCGDIASMVIEQVFRNSEFCQNEGILTVIKATNQMFTMQSQEANLRASVDLGIRSDTRAPNRPAKCTVLPEIRFAKDCERTIRLVSDDQDGDTIKCTFNTQDCVQCSVPTNFRLIEETCELTYTGNGEEGDSVFELTVEEFPHEEITVMFSDGSDNIISPSKPLSVRSLNFAVRVVAPAGSCTEGEVLPALRSPTPADGAVLQATVDQPLEIKISIEARAQIRDLMVSGRSGTNINLSEDVSDNSATMTWTPTVQDAGDLFPLCFAAEILIGTRQQGKMRCAIIYVVREVGEDSQDDGAGGDSQDDGAGGDSQDDGAGGDSQDDGAGGDSQDDGAGGDSQDDGAGGDSQDDGAGGDSQNDGAGGDSQDDGAGGDNQDDGAGGDNQDDGAGGDNQDDGAGGDNQDDGAGGDSQDDGAGGDSQDDGAGGDNQDDGAGGDNQDDGAGGDSQDDGAGGDSKDDKSVICSPTSMSVTADLSIFGEISDATLTLIDTECKATITGTQVTALTGLDSCGTQFDEDNDNVIFKNSIQLLHDGGVITRNDDIELHFSCSYPKMQIVSTLFKALRLSEVFQEDAFGKFSFQFAFFASSTFETKVDTNIKPLEVNMQEMIFMQIKATAAENTVLFVESCRATPEDNPEHETSYSIIENGCIVDSTVQEFESQSREYRIGIKAFRFIGEHDEVYISCSVMLCIMGKAGTRCTKGCIESNERRERSVAGETARHNVIQGPLRLKRSADDKGLSVFSAPSVTINMNLLCVTVLVAVALVSSLVAYKIKKSRNDYVRLPRYDIRSSDSNNAHG